jgi:hypothetical protein
VIVSQDAISPNGPYIRFLKEHDFRFILRVKESDHAHLFKQLDVAIKKKKAGELMVEDPTDPEKLHVFRWMNELSINASHQDVLVNLLEYWEVRGKEKKYSSSG